MAGGTRGGLFAPPDVTDTPQSVCPRPTLTPGLCPALPPSLHGPAPLTPLLSLRSQVSLGGDGSALRGFHRGRAAEQP